MIPVPMWIDPEQYRPLNPPAEIRKLGDVRSAENLLAATRALRVVDARRYRPTPTATWCNIFLADITEILRAPIPHVFDLLDGKGRRELRANDIVSGLRLNRFPGWAPVSREDAANRAALGLPTVAVWKNPQPYSSGHVAIVVPTPADRSGIYVTNAGRFCGEECSITRAFGPYSKQVEFFGHD